jgi:hypothetical protein
MSYDPKNLSVGWYANEYTKWHYRTRDDADEVMADGYFDGAAEMVKTGDQIDVAIDTAGDRGFGTLAVIGVAAGKVNLVLLTSFEAFTGTF